jgi:uncharacterized protein (UPF0262 family)
VECHGHAAARCLTMPRPDKLLSVELDASLGKAPSAEAQHERLIAIHDLIESNHFTLSNGIAGPYRLKLSTMDGRLVFNLSDQTSQPLYSIILSLAPFRRIVKDYFQICDSYNAAIHTSSPQQIETIDMARRGIHNEGSTLLQERLKGKAEFDFNTARRLFTLVCALIWRN